MSNETGEARGKWGRIPAQGPWLLLLFALLLQACTPAHREEAPPPNRVNHIVLCWLKEPGNQEQRQQIIEVSKSFSQLPGVLDVRAGQVIPSDRGIVDDSFDVAIYLTYATVEDMNAYITHPDHQNAVRETFRPLVKKILVYDFIE